MAEPPAAPSPSNLSPAHPPRKKRRLWWKVLLGLLVILIIFILLIPTILSTSVVRSYVVRQVNKSLNGHVEIADWSIGWTDGIDVKAIRVFGKNGTQIAKLDQFSTQLSLIHALFGNLSLGKVSIDGLSFDAKLDANGRLNLVDILRQTTQSQSVARKTVAPSNPSKLPAISGDIILSNSHGTIERAGRPTVLITQLTGEVKITDINQPITDQLTIGLKVGDGPQGRITASGTIDAVKNDQIALDSANVHQTLDAEGIDLHNALAILPARLGIDQMHGMTDARAAIDVTDGKSAVLDVLVKGKNIAVTGPKLKGDTFTTQALVAAIPKATAIFPDGLSKWETGRIQAGAQAGTLPISLKFDQGSMTTIADVQLQSLLNLKDNHKPDADGHMVVRSAIDLGKLASQLRNTLGLKKDVTVTGGTETQAIDLTLSADKAVLAATTDIMGVTGTRAGRAISLQPIHLAMNASDFGGRGALPDLRDLKLTLQSAFANADFHGANLTDLSGSLSGQLQKMQSELAQFVDFGGKQVAGDFNVTLNSRRGQSGLRAKVSAVASLTNLRYVPASVTSNDAKPQAAPLQITGGSLSMRADVSHDGATLLLHVPEISGKEIAFKRGDVAYQAKPFNVQLVASVLTGGGQTLMQRIHKIVMSQLSGNLGVATLSMPTPIVITDLSSASPSADGAIKLDGQLADLTQLLAAWQGEKPDAYPYRGNLTITENLDSQQGAVHVNGNAQVARFQVLQGNKVTFSENLVNVANDLSLTNHFNSLAIRNLLVDMPDSGALKVTIQNGTIDDLVKDRRLNLDAVIQYDLTKLWPIVHPMLTKPGEEDPYKDLAIAGQFSRHEIVTGEYPAGVPFTQAIRHVRFDGGLAVASLNYNGIDLRNLELPLYGIGGKLMTVHGNKPIGQNTAPPAIVNGGKLDLGNVTVDLTQNPPRISTLPNKTVLTGVTINPLFSRSVLAKFINNPVFAGAQQATGLVDLTLVSCDRVPAGALVLQNVPANDGRVDITFSMTNLHIGLQGLTSLGSALKQDSFEANVKNATVSIAHGIETQHVLFQSGSYNLGFDGSVNLQTQQFAPMTVSIPLARIIQNLPNGSNYAKYAPDQAEVTMVGSPAHPELKLDQLIAKALTDAAAKALVGGILPGSKQDNAKPGNQPTAQPGDVLGNLFDKLQQDQQRKKQEQDKQKQKQKKKRQKNANPPADQ